MPPIPCHQLSDEPLYCEAVHDKDDDGFYSGSEDDHYEGPLHRRLHIEKKAIDFLSGNVPILISAALRGPFDRKQWNNPWRSTRAESHAELCKAQRDQSKQTAVPEEDLPDTQGTSLYPLPSPEITNPPSAKKNPYMDEQDYGRVKTWREAVKGTSASKDPFWQSQQDAKDEDPRERKRSADSTWLHKRDRKKLKSANPRTSRPDDSPSSGAARTRGSQPRKLHASQMVAQFLRNSSPPEDELATDGHTRSPRSNTSPMANKIMGMTPHRAKRLFQAPDTSEDELSMPATTPTRSAIRTSTMVSASPKRDPSPSRRRRTTKSKSRPSRSRGNPSIGREKAKKLRVAHTSTSQAPDHDETRTGSRAVAQMAEAALECMDSSPQKSFTKQSEPFQGQLLPDNTSTAKSVVLPQTLATLPSTQQDNSFLFHKRARSPAGIIEGGRSTGVPKKRVARGQSSLQLFATKMNEHEAQSAHGDDPAVPVGPSPTYMTRNNPKEGQCSLIDPERESRDLDFSSAVDEGCPSSHKKPNQQTQSTDGYKTNDQKKMTDDFTAKVEPDATNDSAEVLPLRDTNEQRVPEEAQSLPQVDGASQSDSDWSTYLTENQSPASSSGKGTRKSDDILVVEYGVDGSSDPEWSTFVNTQDITPVIPHPEATVDPEEVITDIAHRDPDIHIDSDQTTLSNLENLPPVYLDTAGMAHDTAQTASVAVCPPGLAGHKGDTSEKPAPGTVSEDSMHTQASVGSIIDAYAEISVLSNSSEPRTAEMPRAVYVETEAEVFASPCSLPNQIATVSVDEAEEHNWSISGGNPQQLQTTLHKSDAAEYLLGMTCDPTKSDETTICIETRNGEDLSGIALQTLRVSEETAGYHDGSSSLYELTAGLETPQLQSSWTQKAISSLQMPPQAPSNETKPGSHSGGLDEAAAQTQSPWNKRADMASHLFVPRITCISPTGSTPDLSFLAGKALAMSQPPQSPWGPQALAAPSPPAQDFEMSIRAFSDFMSPSPVKKRAPSNRNMRGGSSAKPGILFKTPAPRKPDRRVHFAPLPGEQEKCFTESDLDEKDAIYEEEDVSYFDISGRKTGTVRMPKLTTRAASPPPMEMSAVEVGALPDHDQKFAKHFEAMSKRKKPIRKSLRLLPVESQQTATPSQEVSAMAEAFVQASQTRKRGLELAAEKKAESICRSIYVDKTSVPVAMDILEDQENVEPVDDVSLVLDNLDKFLDNTWGIDMGNGESPEIRVRSKQEKEISPSQVAAQKVEDPMLALEANVWAD